MSEETQLSWYQGISRYQWVVLLFASLGWVFDIFEGQIFVASMRDAMPELLNGVSADDPSVRRWNEWSFGTFLLGGAFGGVLFGMLSDKIGRSRTLIYTILFYSLFTCISAFSQEPWHMMVLRFLVAIGVGGEWAVASAMVAEVMPTRSRPTMSSIFHASSVFGTLLAIAAITLLIGNPTVNVWVESTIGISAWRVGFFIGVFPALLTLWIRWKLHAPESWQRAKEREKQDSSQATGQLADLFRKPHLRNTVVGVSLATIGLVTFWGGHIYGKNALLRTAEKDILVAANMPLSPPQKPDIVVMDGAPDPIEITAWKSAKTDYAKAKTKLLGNATEPTKGELKNKAKIKRAEMLSMALNTIGGGLGLVLFGFFSNRMGRKGAFIFYHAIAFVVMMLLFKVLVPGNASSTALMIFLPIFGFFTLGMHAGYAVYFPELFPTRLRGTGAGFCFNMGRLGTAAAFFGFGALATQSTGEQKAIWLAPLYILGVIVVLFARETRGEDLPE